MTGNKPREILAGGLAIRALQAVLGNRRGKPSVALRIPAKWADELKMEPGQMVLLSKSGSTISINAVDEKALIALLRKTEAEP